MTVPSVTLAFMSRILVVEDEHAIADTVLFALRSEGFEADHRLTAGAALTAVAESAFDLAILDVGLPDLSGFALCRELRRLRDLPVIFLTAHVGEVDRVLGFELGADDYMPKPFSPRELVARVRAVLRRTQALRTDARGTEARGTPALGALGFAHDRQGMRVRFRGNLLDLTRYEYRLLATLLDRPGAVLSRAQLMDHAWEDTLESSDRTVDTHIKTLRAKLRMIASDADPIRTHRGLGYSLDVE